MERSAPVARSLRESMPAIQSPSFRLLLPREYRLFQLGHAGGAAGKHFAELVNQRRGRGVDQLPAVMITDHTAGAFGNGDEVEGIYRLDVVKRNAMHGSHLRRIGHDRRACRRPHHDPVSYTHLTLPTIYSV